MGCCEQKKKWVFSIIGSEFLDYKKVCQLVKRTPVCKVRYFQ